MKDSSSPRPVCSALKRIGEYVDRGRACTAASAETIADGVLRFCIYAGLGVVVGATVGALEWITVDQVLSRVHRAPLGWQAVAPGLGLVVTGVLLRVCWRTPPSTADDYVHSFHSGRELRRRALAPKLTGALATIGAGAAAGLEGASIYAGSAIGQAASRRRWRPIGDRTARSLLTAGAAAGVAAVFEAPATGVLFALEAPYRRDLARHALIPALVAAAAAYLTVALAFGVDDRALLVPTEVGLSDEVIGAVVLGLVGGLCARALATLFHWAKTDAVRVAIGARLPLAAAVLAGAAVAAAQLVDTPVTLGPGLDHATQIVLDPTLSIWTIAAIFSLRAVATTATLGAGGVAGVFIPLAVQGLLLGRVVEGVLHSSTTGLYPVVGLAAVLGAGYRTPLAAVMFVAETTGRAEFVIPALLATAVAQAVMGDVSVAHGQVDERQGQLEARLDMPARLVLREVAPITSDETLLAVVDRLDADDDVSAIPVSDGGYVGLLVLHDIAAALLEYGNDARAIDVVREIPAINADDPALRAAHVMNDSNCAAVAVLDSRGEPIGVITPTALSGLRHLGELVVSSDDAGLGHDRCQ